VRTLSNASTISSRPPSASSRNTSNGNFSSSMGPGHSRSKSAHLGRAPGPNSFSQSTTTRPPNAGTKSRPNTSSSNYSDDSSGPYPGKRDGMPQQPSRSSSFQLSKRAQTVPNRGLRHSQSVSLFPIQSTRYNTREVSVTTAMSRLHIDEHSYRQSGHYPEGSKTPKILRRLSHRHSVSTGLSGDWPSMSNQAVVLYEQPEDGVVAVCPKTPSHLPVPRNRRGRDMTAPSSPSKASPRKSLYLTKESDIPALVDWTPNAKLSEMMASFDDFKASMNKPNLLEEAVPLLKQQSKFYLVSDRRYGLTLTQ
jgi:kinesin family protein C1